MVQYGKTEDIILRKGEHMNLLSFFKEKFNNKNLKDEIAEMLKVTPEALDAFEKAYQEASDDEQENSDNLFDVNSRQAVTALLENTTEIDEKVEILVSRIVNELLYQTKRKCLPSNNAETVTLEDIHSVPEDVRPQLTGHLMKTDLKQPSYFALLDMLKRYQRTGDMTAYLCSGKD